MLSSPFFRQGIIELACKQGKNSDEVKVFSEGYACISCFRAVSRYVMQISACEQAFCITARGSVWRRQLKQCMCHFNSLQRTPPSEITNSSMTTFYYL